MSFVSFPFIWWNYASFSSICLCVIGWIVYLQTQFQDLIPIPVDIASFASRISAVTVKLRSLEEIILNLEWALSAVNGDLIEKSKDTQKNVKTHR